MILNYLLHEAAAFVGEIDILLTVRSPTEVTYRGRPEKQELAVHDGWSLPGDVFVRTEEDRFEYESRRDDLIISSGYNIPGTEVESVLQDRDEVYETAIVGSPDEEHGTVVKAFVVRHGTGKHSL
jgi:2-aminobenzoate-CoA ligase